MDAYKADENPAARVLKYVQKKGQGRSAHTAHTAHTVHRARGGVFR